MKRIIYTTVFFLISQFFIGCKNILNEIPDNRAIINDEESIRGLLNNAYPKQSFDLFLESSTDNVEDIGDTVVFELINVRAFNFQDYNTNEATDTSNAYWNGCYHAIAYANKTIETINELGNPKNLEPLLGEALLCRAYAHFLLVNIFSMRYDPSTANTLMGVPYVVDVERNALKKYSRETIQQNYDNIKKDLESGLNLVTDNYDDPKFHFNKNAAYAFATRFYLNVGDWNNVIKYADIIFKGKERNTLSKPFNTTAFTSLSFVNKFAYHSAPTTTQNLLVSLTTTNNYSYSINRFALSKPLKEKFFSKTKIPFQDQQLDWAYFFRTGNGKNFYIAKTYIGYVNKVHFSMDEVLFNRAEAYVMTNQYEKAISDIEAFLGNKLTGFIPSKNKLEFEALKELFPVFENELTPFYDNSLDDDKRVLLKAILEYKRLEFLQEGYRWFDIKRFNIIVNHKHITNQSFVLIKDDPRRAFQIPSREIDYGLKPNPR